MEPTKLKNRYGNEYWFLEIEPNKYAVKGDLKHWRFGGKEDVPGLDLTDLGFADPSGGPFIQLGAILYDKEVVNIDASKEDIVLTLKD